jgi:hypothetical protein
VNVLAGYVWDRWEDYRNGLYVPAIHSDRVDQSAALLRDPDQFFEVAREMLREWPNSAYHNLVNMWSGRNAWIGQASCCYAHQATAADTRQAWGQLSNDEHRAANRVAMFVRELWERGARDAQAVLDL